jgi:hypothetical protein
MADKFAKKQNAVGEKCWGKFTNKTIFGKVIDYDKSENLYLIEWDLGHQDWYKDYDFWYIENLPPRHLKYKFR